MSYAKKFFKSRKGKQIMRNYLKILEQAKKDKVPIKICTGFVTEEEDPLLMRVGCGDKHIRFTPFRKSATSFFRNHDVFDNQKSASLMLELVPEFERIAKEYCLEVEHDDGATKIASQKLTDYY